MVSSEKNMGNDSDYLICVWMCLVYVSISYVFCNILYLLESKYSLQYRSSLFRFRSVFWFQLTSFKLSQGTSSRIEVEVVSSPPRARLYDMNNRSYWLKISRDGSNNKSNTNAKSVLLISSSLRPKCSDWSISWPICLHKVSVDSYLVAFYYRCAKACTSWLLTTSHTIFSIQLFILSPQTTPFSQSSWLPNFPLSLTQLPPQTPNFGSANLCASSITTHGSAEASQHVGHKDVGGQRRSESSQLCKAETRKETALWKRHR